MTCGPFTPSHCHTSETIFLDIRPHGISPNSPVIWQRQPKRWPRWPHLRRDHRLASRSEVVNSMNPTAKIVLLTDDKNSDEAESGGPKKRPSAWAPGGAASTERTHHPSTTRTQRPLKEKSKAAGRGAERLASTMAQGVSPRSLLGLSIPQGSMEALEYEQPSWIVGREQVGMWRHTGRSAPQQISLRESSEDGEDLCQIPGNMSERERSMLQMTQAERERGAVRTIKCKLCPKVSLRTWATFQRHCKTCKKHPLELDFCRWCGVYFARSDSRNRHEKDQVCRNQPDHEATMQKKAKIERLFEAFNSRLTHCLKNGEEIELMFSDAMSEVLTGTSKKVSKKKISLEGTWAAGLC